MQNLKLKAENRGIFPFKIIFMRSNSFYVANISIGFWMDSQNFLNFSFTFQVFYENKFLKINLCNFFRLIFTPKNKFFIKIFFEI